MSSPHSLNLALARLTAEDAVLVTVAASRGSVPREPGAWMLVFAHAVLGTIGGGHLEHEALQLSRARLAGGLVGEEGCDAQGESAHGSRVAAQSFGERVQPADGQTRV